MGNPKQQESIKDWTKGTPGIAFQQCQDCSHSWYHERDFCPRCGGSDIQTRQAKGEGIVEALTVIHRAPSKVLSKQTPYTVILVRMDEGFLVMGHAASNEQGIGTCVTARFRPFGDCEYIPVFS